MTLQPGGCGASSLLGSAIEAEHPETSAAVGRHGGNVSNSCSCVQSEPAPTHVMFSPFPSRISHISIIPAQLHPYSGELAATALLKQFSFSR